MNTNKQFNKQHSSSYIEHMVGLRTQSIMVNDVHVGMQCVHTLNLAGIPTNFLLNSNTKPKRRFIKIFFHHKAIYKVNLTNIFHNKLVESKVPIYFQERDPPLISCQYTQNISRSVFNYNQTLYDIDVDNYNTTSSSCDCESSPSRYEPHGHVITGDLRIVKNRNLRRLLEKGPKYREQNTVDWKLNEKIITKAIDDYSNNYNKREAYRMSALEEWSEIVKLIIKGPLHYFFGPLLGKNSIVHNLT